MRYSTLYNIILEQIRSYARKAGEREDGIAKGIALEREDGEQCERALVEGSIAKDSARLTALDRLIAKLYEDMVENRISPENFNSLLQRSQAEQNALRNRLERSTERLVKQDREQEDDSRWIAVIKEYADVKELDAAMLNKLVRKIVIHEDPDGNTVRQTVEVHFNFMGQTEKYMLVRE